MNTEIADIYFILSYFPKSEIWNLMGMSTIDFIFVPSSVAGSHFGMYEMILCASLSS